MVPQTLGSLLNQIGASLSEIAFPARCACCGEYGQGRPMCAECSNAVMRDRLMQACPICAASAGPITPSWEGCGSCRDEQHRIDGTARVGPYGSHIGHMLRQYKFQHREDIEPLLSEWMADSVLGARWAERIEAVTYVPTHWRRALGGRLHAARGLARNLARRLDLPWVNLLRRTRAGLRQVGLTYVQRRDNVRGAFALLSGVRLRGATILLVDDVRTTGATLDECARALRRGGAGAVYASVVARAKGVDDDLMFP